MKQLIIINDIETDIFFSNTSTIDGIVKWLESYMGERLDLEEAHSCIVSEHRGTIVISGDEDFLEIEIKTINPINA